MSNATIFSDFPQIAGLYSQLAGVLAGFAFAGLITLIAAQLVSESKADLALRSYRPLIGAFLGLVATSLNYAVIAGEDRDTARLAELEVTAGLGFCVAGTMALHSILVLLRGVERDLSSAGSLSGRTADLLRATLIFGICPLLIVMMYGAVGDHLLAKYGKSGFHGLDLATLILLVITIGITPIIKRQYGKATGADRLVDNLSRIAVGIAVLSLLATTLTISFVGKDTVYPDYLPLACLCVLSAFLWGVMYSTAQYRP